MPPNPLRPFEGPLKVQEEYRGSYIPKVIQSWRGPQVVAPDTPYVAASGKNRLYFIDTRFDSDTARHIKEQIERASIPKPEEAVHIDEILGTAELKNSHTKETTFVFDTLYARVIWARFINKRNPEIKLPEYEPDESSTITYDLEAISSNT